MVATRPQSLAPSLSRACKYINVDGVKTRYYVRGQTTQHTPVMLMHGIGRSLEDWSEVVQPLSEERQVYAFDQIGFGRTEKPKRSYTFNELRDFSLRFMDTVKLERAVLAGNSLGGAVALRIALSYPERVAGLVLSAPAGLGREMALPLRLCTVPLLGEYLTRRPSQRPDGKHKEGVTKALEACFYDHRFVTQERIDYDYDLSLLPGSQLTFLTTLRASCNWRGSRPVFLKNVLEKLSELSTPTLVVWGKQDHILPVKYAENARRIPAAKIHVLEECGHFPQLEQAETFNRLTLNFLREKRL
jgi:pimeloyl-ACP methyl ester carboxylesterase